MLPETLRHRFRLAPAWLAIVLAAVEALLWLADRFTLFGRPIHKGYAVLAALLAATLFVLCLLLGQLLAWLFRRPFQFVQLETLILNNTAVTDQGVVGLRCLTNLKLLCLVDTRATYASGNQLHRVLPRCRFHYNCPEDVFFTDDTE